MALMYADENVPQLTVDTLRSLGHDVLTAFEVGRANQGIPDADQLQFAVAAGRAVLTNNGWDFNRLHSTDPSHEGIVIYTQDPDFVGLAKRIHTAVAGIPTLTGQLIKITRPAGP